jgi:hypothetical protein
MTDVPILLSDRRLERDIALARERMQSCFRSGSIGLAHVWFGKLRELIASRSSERVDEIEREKGLASLEKTGKGWR